MNFVLSVRNDIRAGRQNWRVIAALAIPSFVVGAFVPFLAVALR